MSERQIVETMPITSIQPNGKIIITHVIANAHGPVRQSDTQPRLISRRNPGGRIFHAMLARQWAWKERDTLGYRYCSRFRQDMNVGPELLPNRSAIHAVPGVGIMVAGDHVCGNPRLIVHDGGNRFNDRWTDLVVLE